MGLCGAASGLGRGWAADVWPRSRCCGGGAGGRGRDRCPLFWVIRARTGRAAWAWTACEFWREGLRDRLAMDGNGRGSGASRGRGRAGLGTGGSGLAGAIRAWEPGPDCGRGEEVRGEGGREGERGMEGRARGYLSAYCIAGAVGGWDREMSAGE